MAWFTTEKNDCAGWDQGLLGMCVGEKRKLKIPAKLGYGAQGSPPKIPGNASGLTFFVFLLSCIFLFPGCCRRTTCCLVKFIIMRDTAVYDDHIYELAFAILSDMVLITGRRSDPYLRHGACGRQWEVVI